MIFGTRMVDSQGDRYRKNLGYLLSCRSGRTEILISVVLKAPEQRQAFRAVSSDRGRIPIVSTSLSNDSAVVEGMSNLSCNHNCNVYNHLK